MAHKSKKLAIEVLRRSGAFFRANTSGDVISAMVGATIGVVGSAFAGLGLGARAVAIDGKRVRAPSPIGSSMRPAQW